jgi:hypothetical protein
MGGRLGSTRADGMWKLVFHERQGPRITVDKTAPWLPSRQIAETWARYFIEQGYHVSLQSQDGSVERLIPGLP